MYTVYTHQSVPFLNSALKTQPQVRPVEQIKRMKKLSKVIQVSFTKPTSADESDTKLARSFWRDDPKNLNILKHNPCETELLDIGKTSIIKEEIIKSEISKLRSMLEKKATIEDNLVNLEAAKKQKQ